MLVHVEVRLQETKTCVTWKQLTPANGIEVSQFDEGWLWLQKSLEYKRDRLYRIVQVHTMAQSTQPLPILTTIDPTTVNKNLLVEERQYSYDELLALGRQADSSKTPIEVVEKAKATLTELADQLGIDYDASATWRNVAEEIWDKGCEENEPTGDVK